MPNNRKPFGYSYLLDMYNCKPGSADDLEICYRFLEKLVRILNMHPMGAPQVIHGPTNELGEEKYPDKWGYTGFIPLIESGITIHGLEEKHFITLDVYSCRHFNWLDVFNYASETFEFTNYEGQIIERGKHYHG